MKVKHAKRPYFKSISSEAKSLYIKEETSFIWHSGMALVNWQKSIEEMHRSIKEKYPKLEILEISTKSLQELGTKLSALNLTINTHGVKLSVENAYQGSKVFENAGPFQDLYQFANGSAKRDSRINNSGKVIGFKFFDQDWSKDPSSLFYDWLYIIALAENEELSSQVLKYDIFTDIAFNPVKSINTQARAAAIYVSLVRKGLAGVWSNKDEFIKAYHVDELPLQGTFNL